MLTAGKIIEFIIEDVGTQPENRFATEKSLVVGFGDGLQVTLDLDAHSCQVHQQWLLKHSLDLSTRWDQPQKCAELILVLLHSLGKTPEHQQAAPFGKHSDSRTETSL